MTLSNAPRDRQAKTGAFRSVWGTAKEAIENSAFLAFRQTGAGIDNLEDRPVALTTEGHVN